MSGETGTPKEFEPIFGREKGVVWAADVEPDQFAKTMEQIGDVDGLVGIKIGFEVGLGLGLKEAVKIATMNTRAVIQYDHQKAGNDIPETSINFVRAMVNAEVDSAILFPFTGPETQIAWTKGLKSEGIGVFTGAEMTHKRFKKAQGGSIPETSLARIFDVALLEGVDNFIVPGNKRESVLKWRKKIEKIRGVGGFALAAPGFVDQGGSITEAGEVAGRIWHPIIGRGIHDNKNMNPREAVEFYVKQLRGEISD